MSWFLFFSLFSLESREDFVGDGISEEITEGISERISNGLSDEIRDGSSEE